MSKALVVLSGGQDSTTCLYSALHAGFNEVHAITFDYGQRHSREIECAKVIAHHASVARECHGLSASAGGFRKVVSHEIIGLGDHVLKSTSPLVSDSDLEQYRNFNSLPGGIEKTFVPMRNQLFLTIAANRAVALGCETLITGVCQEDFGGYPDCRQVFIDGIERATNLAIEGDAPPIKIMTPLMSLNKAETVHMAAGMPGCYGMLANTHTSYDGNYPPIGRDHATLLRAKGFAEAGIPDPLVLRAIGEGLMRTPTTPNYDPDVVTKWSAVMMRDLVLQGF